MENRVAEKPKTGFFKTKTAQAKELKTWQHKVNVVTAERDGVLRQIKSVESGRVFIESQEKIQVEAARQAARALPEQAAITKAYRADIQIAELNSKLRKIDRDITTARSAGDEKSLSQLLKSKSGLLNRLQNRESLNRRLGNKEKDEIGKAIQANKRELNLFKSRSLGLGR